MHPDDPESLDLAPADHSIIAEFFLREEPEEDDDEEEENDGDGEDDDDADANGYSE